MEIFELSPEKNWWKNFEIHPPPPSKISGFTEDNWIFGQIVVSKIHSQVYLEILSWSIIEQFMRQFLRN